MWNFSSDESVVEIEKVRDFWSSFLRRRNVTTDDNKSSNSFTLRFPLGTVVPILSSLVEHFNTLALSRVRLSRQTHSHPRPRLSPRSSPSSPLRQDLRVGERLRPRCEHRLQGGWTFEGQGPLRSPGPQGTQGILRPRLRANSLLLSSRSSDACPVGLLREPY